MLLAKAGTELDNLMDFNLSHTFSSLTDSFGEAVTVTVTQCATQMYAYSYICYIVYIVYLSYIYICCDIVQLYNGNYAQQNV